MKNHDKHPDRPIPKWQFPIRILVRHYRAVYIKLRYPSKVSLGKNVNFGRYTEIRSPNFACFDDNINIGPWFLTESNLKIGSDVLISSKVSFVGNDHAFDDDSKTVYFQGRKPPSTAILEGDNLIGFGSIIVGNVTVGKGCIVGAGSVVTKSLPPYTVCAGVPAKVIRSRYK